MSSNGAGEPVEKSSASSESYGALQSGRLETARGTQMTCLAASCLNMKRAIGI